MIIEYRIEQIPIYGTNLFKYYPEYRRKLSSIFKIFQIFFTWTTFTRLNNFGALQGISFKSFTEANDFLENEVYLIGPIEYNKKYKNSGKILKTIEY
jgi:hypothetical protein